MKAKMSGRKFGAGEKKVDPFDPSNAGAAGIAECLSLRNWPSRLGF